MKLFVAQTPITRLFSIVEKLNISFIYKSIILIFLVNLPVIFFRKENLIQPPGEPRQLNLLNFNNEHQN